jgi:hypothetical protein
MRLEFRVSLQSYSRGFTVVACRLFIILVGKIKTAKKSVGDGPYWELLFLVSLELSLSYAFHESDLQPRTSCISVSKAPSVNVS